MTKKEEEYLQKEFGEIKEMIKKIDRGMYGDAENDVPGLIQRQAEDDQKWQILQPVIEEIDTFQRMVNVFKFLTAKATWGIVSGIGTIIGFIIINWEKIKTFSIK